MIRNRVNSSSMKPKRSTKLLEEQLTNLRDRIPLQAGVCKSDDLSFFSLLYLIMMQTLGVVLFSIYTLINFCTIILSVVKFFLGWVINLLQTSSKSSILIKLFVITLELMALIFLVYKIASLIFVPIIGVQLTVATRLVQGEKEDAKGALAGNETQTEEGADMKAESSQGRITRQQGFQKSTHNKTTENKSINSTALVEEEFYSELNMKDKSLIKINCGAEYFNKTHIKRRVVILKEGMSIDDVKSLCYS